MRAPRTGLVLAALFFAAPLRAESDHSTFVPGNTRTIATSDSIAETSRVTQGNQVGATLTNYGFIGNNFITRSPSLEYPLGSGIEHLGRAGLWIGAHAVDSLGAFIGVTTAALDGSHGFPTGEGSEFTPAGTEIATLSRLPGSPSYDPNAVSELDYVTSYSDRPGGYTTLNLEDHRPLNLLVRQSAYTWTWPSLADVLFLRFRIINRGANPLTGVYVGMYTEFASGDKNSYTCWPPSGTCGATGGWYAKAWLQYDPSLRMLREHYCGGLPVPSGCHLERAPCWMGVQVLTPPTGSQVVTLSGWPWEPLSYDRDLDVERYPLMSSGTILDLTQLDFMPLTGDAVELLSLGPFATIAPGDSITVDFALVGGAEVADIQANATRAQQVRDANFDATTPVAASLVSATADPDRVRLSWRVDNGTRARIERSRDGGVWNAVAEPSADGAGRIAWEDLDVTAGRYGYRLRNGAGTGGETWVDVPAPGGLAIHGLTPNPSRGGPLAARLSLPRSGEVRFELVDVGGRVVSRSGWTLAAGSRTMPLPGAERLAPGVYLARLTQGAERVESRVVITH